MKRSIILAWAALVAACFTSSILSAQETQTMTKDVQPGATVLAFIYQLQSASFNILAFAFYPPYSHKICFVFREKRLYRCKSKVFFKI